jgi:peptide-methionine (R)-S-oxide reductase
LYYLYDRNSVSTRYKNPPAQRASKVPPSCSGSKRLASPKNGLNLKLLSDFETNKSFYTGLAMNRRYLFYGFLGLALLAIFTWMTSTRTGSQDVTPDAKGNPMIEPIIKTDAEWRALLPPDVYHIMREKGTEPAFSSPLHNNHAKGIYYCAACDLDLFTSEAKFDSGTGWPSFFQPIDQHVATKPDNSFFTKRTEVLCARCGGHLGHVFNDGPPPTGLRYCMNGLALKFKATGEEKGK